jgi:hypothetical protein
MRDEQNIVFRIRNKIANFVRGFTYEKQVYFNAKFAMDYAKFAKPTLRPLRKP